VILNDDLLGEQRKLPVVVKLSAVKHCILFFGVNAPAKAARVAAVLKPLWSLMVASYAHQSKKPRPFAAGARHPPDALSIRDKQVQYS
jgi:hypothetical protein